MKFKNIRSIDFALGIFLSLLSSLIGILIPLFVKALIDNFNASNIIKLALGFIVECLLSSISIYTLSIYGNKKASILRSNIYKHLILENEANLNNLNSGKTVGLIINSTNTLSDYYSLSMPSFISSIFTIIGTLTALIIMDWRLTLLMFVTLPLLGIIIIPIERISTKYEGRLQTTLSKLSGYMTESLQNNALIKIYVAEKNSIENNDKLIEKTFDNSKNLNIITSITSPLVFLFIFGIISVIFIYGGLRVAHGFMKISTLVSFLIYLFQILNPISYFTNYFSEKGKKEAALIQINDLMNKEIEKSGYIKIEIKNKDITFHDLTFAYPDSNNNTLNKISITFEAGKKTALVGPTGSGKSTIVNLISGLYQNFNNGFITIGNIPIQQIDLKYYRKQIGFVTQDTYLLDGTIYDNLIFGLSEVPSKQKIYSALKKATLYKEISNLKDGIYTKIGERGIKLSGGQRQRLQIARIFLREPKVLILDEATANLDSEAESEVTIALQKLMKDRTTITIAHRLATIKKSDLIYFIEKGTITGQGTHEELYKNHNKYRTYVDQQTL
ncbi:ABC transporter ATP-binding protein [Lactobacillus sp. ESL0230]|uniref:ABC transporter ATP-binding protein n=1 Tax=Lactobacillus sp. ESL0230 TaxID=2069353 RepID=UPI000EFC2E6A|nr:ABC transporter ATP-binding protein [Lactobacillus sp. ESL0230]RMC46723.1 ABC transporter ATP-binding protein [Lactobacillus sp. ESL0230]